MSIIKERIHRMNNSGSYDIVHNETDTTMVMHNDKTLYEILEEIINYIQEQKQNENSNNG